MGFKKVRPHKKVCNFCKAKVTHIDYKDVETLSKYITPNGKIASRNSTGACAKHQRHIAQQIKWARFMALIPYVK